MLIRVRQKLLHVLALVAYYFHIIIPKFLHPHWPTHKGGCVLEYPNEDPQHNIPLITILNEIPSIVFPLIFLHY